MDISQSYLDDCSSLVDFSQCMHHVFAKIREGVKTLLRKRGFDTLPNKTAKKFSPTCSTRPTERCNQKQEVAAGRQAAAAPPTAAL